MLTLKNSFRSVVNTVLLATLSVSSTMVHPLLAQELISMHGLHQKTNLKLPTTQDPGAPIGRREGGSSRRLCKSEAEVMEGHCLTARLTALVPETPISPDKKQVWGWTTAEHPEFFFYLSKFRNPQNKQATQLPIEFVLIDENDQYVYQTEFVLPLREGGIIRLPIPTSRPPLEVDKRYTWTLNTRFNQNERNFVQGSIYRKRLTSERRQQLQAAAPLKRLEILLQEGLWFDAVSTLVDLKETDPLDLKLKSMWKHVLHDINLQELAAKPFLSCCTPEPQASVKESRKP